MGFSEDLKTGEKDEEIFKRHMESLGYCSKKKNGKFPEYDFTSSNNKNSFISEIKFDVMANKTGNIAIEIWNSKLDKPSGISVTKADVWVQVLSKDMILIGLVKNIKEMLIYVKPHRTIEFGGDKNATLALYKLSFLLEQEVFLILNNMTKEDFVKFLEGRKVENGEKCS